MEGTRTRLSISAEEGDEANWNTDLTLPSSCVEVEYGSSIEEDDDDFVDADENIPR